MKHRPIDLDTERLAGLIYELASQLHVERTQRIALELALERAGVIDGQSVATLAVDPALRERSAAALKRSMAKLMRIVTESADPSRPLRRDVPSSSGR